jgi:phage-related minor tail protein
MPDSKQITLIMQMRDELSSALQKQGQSIDALSAKVNALDSSLNRVAARQVTLAQQTKSLGTALQGNTSALTQLTNAQTTHSNVLQSVATNTKGVTSAAVAGAAAARTGSTAANQQTTAVKALGAAHGSAAIRFRETLVLLREFGRGNTSQMLGSASILFNQGFKVPPQLFLLGAVILGAGAAFVYFEDKGSKAFKNVAEAAKQMGSAIGLSTSQLSQQADKIATSGQFSIADTRNLQAQALRAGVISPQALEGILANSHNFAALTGQTQAAGNKQLTEMIGDPSKGLKELSTVIPILTAKEQDLVHKLIQHNEITQAQTVLMDALTQKSKGAADEGLGYLGRAIDSLKKKASEVGNAIMNAGVPSSSGDADRLLQTLRNQTATAARAGDASGLPVAFGSPGGLPSSSDILARRRALLGTEGPEAGGPAISPELQRLTHELVAAVYQNESGSGQNNSIHTINGQRIGGPMQIAEGTGAPYLKPGEDLFNFNTNMRVSTQILQDYIVKYKDVDKALIAYNAGPKYVNTPHDQLSQEIQKYLDQAHQYISAAGNVTGTSEGGEQAAMISAVRAYVHGVDRAQGDSTTAKAVDAYRQSKEKFDASDPKERAFNEGTSIYSRARDALNAPGLSDEDKKNLQLLQSRGDFQRHTAISDTERQRLVTQAETKAGGMPPQQAQEYLAGRLKEIELLGTLHSQEEVEAASKAAMARVAREHASALKLTNLELAASTDGLKKEAAAYAVSQAEGIRAAAQREANMKGLQNDGISPDVRTNQLLAEGSAKALSTLNQQVVKSNEAAEAALKLAGATNISVVEQKKQEVQNRATAASADAMAHALSLATDAERAAAVAQVTVARDKLATNFKTEENSKETVDFNKSMAHAKEQLAINEAEYKAVQDGSKGAKEQVDILKAKFALQQQFPNMTDEEAKAWVEVNKQIGAVHDKTLKAEEALKPYQELTKQIESSMNSVFDSLLTNGTRSMQNIRRLVGDSMRKIASDIANTFVFKPLENGIASQLFGSGVVPGGSAAGATGGLFSGATGAAGGGLLGGAFSWLHGLVSGGAGSSLSAAALSDEGFAHGGAFTNGIRWMAQGDIVNSPTLIGRVGSKAGVAGEAGPEAVLPLSRDKSGNLGVASSGHGAAFSPTVIINNNAPGGDKRQNADAAAQSAAAVQHALNAMFTSGVRNEQRPGGMLNQMSQLS